jgi:uncharacterized Zn-binding protein involved in type VI secretion
MADDPASKPPRPGALPGNGALPRPASGDELRRLLDEQAAALEARIRQACQPEPPSPVACNKLGARKDARFMAICTAPSINWTPAGAGKVPVPYQTVQDLSNSMSTARTVRFNGLPAYLLDQTVQPKGTGDERGTGKGIRSGTVGGEVKPVSGCKTVRIEGKLVVREGDKCTMTGGNNSGKYVTKAIPSEVTNTLPSDIFPLAQPSSSAVNLLRNKTRENIDILYTCRPTKNIHRYQHNLKIWNYKEEEARKLRTRNSLAIILMGYHGIFGALSRILGQDEESVAKATMIGASTLGIEAGVAGSMASQQMVASTYQNLPSAGFRISGAGPTGRTPPTNVYHATTSPAQAQNILNGIDPKYLNPQSRFGAAFYVAVQPRTALAELAHHNVVATTGIRYEVNIKALRVLDLTNPELARKYNYHGGPITPATKEVGTRAVVDGYNAIKFNSERSVGEANYAILQNHNEILKPVGVSPIK